MNAKTKKRRVDQAVQAQARQARAISRQTGLPCEVADSFARIQIDEREFKEEFLEDIAPQAAVVVGLAMRRRADK